VADLDDTRALPRDRTPPSDADNVLYGDELAPGALAGEYAILGTIAAGGSGTVYSAQHRVLDRRAAVKVLHRDLIQSTEMIERFLREARVVNLIRHPNIVDIYEIGQLGDGRPFLVMEFLDGHNLERTLARQTFAPADALELLAPVCAALEAAHEKGVVHRDVKASNVFVTRATGPQRVKLLDFGIAKVLHSNQAASGMTTVGRQLGTPTSMSPEQILGEPVDVRTDIYSLGVLLYQLLTGRMPFVSEDPLELERLHLEAPPPRPSAVAAVWPAIDEVVLRSLAKSREQRYATVRDFSAALGEAISQAPSRKSGASAQTVPAVAIYVDVRVEGESQDRMDDALLDDLGQVLDIAERALRGAKFLLALETGSALLGAQVLGESESSTRQHAIATALGIVEQLAARPGADSRIGFGICVHTGLVIARKGPDGVEIIGGPLTRVASWAPQELVAKACATAEAAYGLDVKGTLTDRYLVLAR